MKSNHIPEYDTIVEEGNILTDPEQSKEHITKYFENLYQAREATNENQEVTRNITQKVQAWALHNDQNIPIEPITMYELNKVISKLRNGKSNGPDEIPNKIFTNADEDTKIYT